MEKFGLKLFECQGHLYVHEKTAGLSREEIIEKLERCEKSCIRYQNELKRAKAKLKKRKICVKMPPVSSAAVSLPGDKH
jgi:predicted DNA-binding protein YlxM (UPF0122 family)